MHGYTPHHLDFPGSVTLRWNVFVESLLDQCRSLCHHGFDRILIVNGHGSNIPLVNMAARLINVEFREAVCASSFYLTSPRSLELIEEIRARARRDGPRVRARDVAVPRIRPDLVQMEHAVKEIPSSYTEHVWMDWTTARSRTCRTGAIHGVGRHGRREVATAETGRAAATSVEEVAEYIADVASRARQPGRDQH